MHGWGASLVLGDTGHLEEKPGSCPREAYSLCKIPRGKCAMMMRGVARECREMQGTQGPDKNRYLPREGGT